MAKKKTFNQLIYVHIDGEPGDEYLSAHETVDDVISSVGHGGRVAVYRLAEIREASITNELKLPKKSR